MPTWAARIVYAEAFHLEPHRVNPPVAWWLRWQTWLQAQSSRAAHQHAKRSENWAKELSPAEIKAMLWANDGDSTD